MRAVIFALLATYALTAAISYDESTWPALCKDGRGNSPIDFPPESSSDWVKSDSYLQLLFSNYTVLKDNAFTWNEKRFGIDLPANPGSLMVRKNGIVYRYDLANIHYHIESEHTFNGKQYQFELHMVHAKNTTHLQNIGILDDPDKRNKYLVVGLVFQASGEADNDDITRMKLTTQENVDNLDFNKYIEELDTFYHYEGGLTTPACDEVVNWVVISKIFTMSNAQFNPAKEWMYKAFPTGNDRAPRPIFNRTLYRIENKLFNERFPRENTMNWKIIVSVVVTAVGISLIFALIWFLCCRKRNMNHVNHTQTVPVQSSN